MLVFFLFGRGQRKTYYVADFQFGFDFRFLLECFNVEQLMNEELANVTIRKCRLPDILARIGSESLAIG